MSPPPPVDYGPDIESAIAATQLRLAALPSPETDPGSPDPGPVPSEAATRWTAISLLEGDPQVRGAVAARPGGATILAERDELDRHLRSVQDLDLSLVLAERRFERAHDVAARVAPTGPSRRRLGDRIDRIVTHRIFGLPVLFAVMYVMFRLVTDVAAPFVDWIDVTLSGTVGPWVASGLGAVGLGGGWVERLAVDGILGGVGGMLAFVPVIAMLYVVLGLLEDTGYLARAAYITDRAMAPIGLPGKAVLPLVVGFGCNVPALMATRVLERPKDRLLTGLLVPFVSCAARLPVYVLLAGALFPGREGAVVFALYLASIAAVFLVGLVLSHTLFRGSERAAFVLELPPYRRPSLRTVWSQTRQRSAAFIRKAGSVILVAAVVVWVFLALPVHGGARFGEVPQEDSLFGAVAGATTPVFRPAGFGAPELSGALAAGFVAKEIVVSTMRQTIGGETDDGASGDDAGPGIASGLADVGTGLASSAGDALLAVPGIVGLHLGGGSGDDNPNLGTEQALRRVFDESSGGHSQPAAAAFMVFVLLYVPCFATVATFGREFGRRWAAVSVILSLVVAWIAAVGVFQVGRALEAI
jgi:ferrous iron transport protein B